MNYNYLIQLNETYKNEVYLEETLSEDELVDIQEWVEALIQEGYNLDDYTDDELYEAYLEDLDEANRIDKGLSPLVKRQLRNDRIRDDVSSSDPTAHTEPGLENSRKGMHKLMRGQKKPEARSRPTGPGKYGVMQRRGMSVSDRLRKEVLKRGMKEEYDIYDIIFSHLLDEGYADTQEAAEVMMVNMSEEWRESIVNSFIEEGFISPYKEPPAHGRSIDNPGRLSPAMRALQKSDKLQTTEPGSQRQKNQTRRSNQLNRMFSAARNA